MRGKRIVLAITGGIAAYKSATIASQLTQRGADVRVLMTEAATQFITPLTLQTLTRNPVAVDTFAEDNPNVVNHIDIADHADLFIIAPITANTIGQMANGLAQDMLTTTWLATQAPTLIAPAMNVHMYDHPLVQENMKKLQQLGVHVVDPNEGQLACGYVGRGRMAEPEQIINWVNRFFQQEASLKGKHVLITAGPTIEPLDPVRYFSNYSSGKMGYAMAQAAYELGAKVTLISGPVSLDPPLGVQTVQVKSAQEMYEAVMQNLVHADIVVKTAAVADYRPETIAKQKIKKESDSLTIQMVKNQDIAWEIGKQKREDQILIGFAAETDHLADHAKEKLARKGLDYIVANDVTVAGAGFSTDTNIVTLYGRDGEEWTLPKLTKIEVARRLLTYIAENNKMRKR
ncbi:phosphopantothenoylcysteine decarboxylase / phosphopantothenate--cysteine ligase [Seinonella peptonophila]|uniref:Coenzyme A biosynthesis bifunctional protein CoaBC n=2 Tax=Seinonella peptonophila TaxID=112248 RepID=A0A1M4UWK5_9BACL|nr:phosphopantothenoylcysteine decarboxylase / phosphopantothenate--cysteine ligase [Seinonella peptonophila]